MTFATSCIFRKKVIRCYNRGLSHTNLDSKIERGAEEEATEAYILVRRVDYDEGNKVI
jgi:hypothetical protein